MFATPAFLVLIAAAPERVYDVDPIVDASLTLSLALVAGLYDLEKKTLKDVSPCDERDLVGRLPCDPSTVNGFDRFVTRLDSKWARQASDVLLGAFFLLPLAGAGVEALFSEGPDRGARFGEDLVVGYQAVAATMLVTTLLKITFQRPRPLTYNAAFDSEFRLAGDARLSFPSGHASISFAAATAFAVPLLSRHSGAGPVVAVSIAYALAAVNASLRVLGGKHFVTDVLAGTMLGLGVGWLVTHAHSAGPELEVGETRALAPGQNGSGVRVWTLGGTF